VERNFSGCRVREHGAARGEAFAVEGARAEAADGVPVFLRKDHCAVVDDRDVFARDLFASMPLKKEAWR